MTVLAAFAAAWAVLIVAVVVGLWWWHRKRPAPPPVVRSDYPLGHVDLVVGTATTRPPGVVAPYDWAQADDNPVYPDRWPVQEAQS